MKRLSFLKKLSIIGASAITVAPVVLAATSCTSTSMKVDGFDYNQILASDGFAIEPNNASKSFRSLLYGTNSAYEGNYILLVGSNMFDPTCKFFTNDGRVRERDLWYKDSFKDSVLWNAVQLASVDFSSAPQGIKNFGVYCAIDFFNDHVYDKKGHEIKVYAGKQEGIQDRIGPFDKWTDTLISQTKIFNKSEDCPLGKYDWDDKSVTTDDYIRNDDFAKSYRAFCQRGALVYPKQEPEPDPEKSNERTITFDTDANNKTSLILVFKDGVLKTIESIPSDYNTLEKTIVDNFKKGEEEDPEPEPEPEAII